MGMKKTMEEKKRKMIPLNKKKKKTLAEPSSRRAKTQEYREIQLHFQNLQRL